MRSIAKFVWLLLVVASLFSCDYEEKWASGKYKVYWIDESARLELGYDVGNGGIIGRVRPRVISVGENARWIVAARDPIGDGSKTEYFYISKPDDGPSKSMDEVVQGPFTAAEFKQKSADLSLPGFTHHF